MRWNCHPSIQLQGHIIKYTNMTILIKQEVTIRWTKPLKLIVLDYHPINTCAVRGPLWISYENSCWPSDPSTQIEPHAMGENIFTNYSILAPHLELTKPKPKIHKIHSHYHTDILYPYGYRTKYRQRLSMLLGRSNLFYFSQQQSYDLPNVACGFILFILSYFYCAF